MEHAITMVHRLPSWQEFNTLRQSCGWQTFSAEIAAGALSNSLYCVVAEDNSRTIGMGRLVGDGLIYVYVQDVLVLPEYQRLGIGSRMMSEMFNWMDENVPDNTNIGLFASKGRENFYRAFGFLDRPNERFGAGMSANKYAIKPPGYEKR